MLQNLDYCNPIEIYEAPFELFNLNVCAKRISLVI